MLKILVVENGSGFGGAVTSLGSFLSSIPYSSNYKFHLVTSYHQDYIKKQGVVEFVGVIKRNRLYGTKSKFEKMLSKLIGKFSGNICFLIDIMIYGRKYSHHIQKYIIENNIDLVYMNNSILCNDAAIFGAYMAKIPIVLHARAPDYNSRITSWLANRVDHFFPISKYVQRSLLNLGVPVVKQTIVPEGLDCKSFSRGANGISFKHELSIPEDKLIIGMIGCLIKWKGHRVFLEACAKAFVETDTIALIVGGSPDGDPSFEEELKQYAKELNIVERVLFVGHRSDVSSAIQACDLIVHASINPEPFGRVLLEGMALGKAVIATNCGGPAEIITDCVDGLLVPPNDSSAMSEAILLLIKDGYLRENLASTGLQTVASKYSIENHREKIISTFRKLIH